MDWLRAAAHGQTRLVIAGREVFQGDLLADGGFAYVYRGSDAQTGEKVAIRRALVQDSDAESAARTEIALLQRLPPHAHVVLFFGGELVNMHGKRESITLFELCSNTLVGRLEAALALKSKDLTLQCPCLPEVEVLEVLGGTSDALSHVHDAGIVHYDVKSENLLLGADGLWKLADFGSASERTFDFEEAPKQRMLDAEEFIHNRCTPIYRPPEVADLYLKWPIGQKVDIFALGCVLFATMTGTHPFPIDSTLANISATFHLPRDATHYDPSFSYWVRRLLAREPKERPSASELKGETQQYKHFGARPRGANVQGDAMFPAFPVGGPNWTADFSQAPPAPLAAPSWEADFSQVQPAPTAEGGHTSWPPVETPEPSTEVASGTASPVARDLEEEATAHTAALTEPTTPVELTSPAVPDESDRVHEELLEANAAYGQETGKVERPRRRRLFPCFCSRVRTLDD